MEFLPPKSDWYDLVDYNASFLGVYGYGVAAFEDAVVCNPGFKVVGFSLR